MACSFLATAANAAPDHVILLHGLCRTSHSMRVMEKHLQQAGYEVLNVDYPSRSAGVERLSEMAIGPALSKCREEGATRIHFVTHSLGGILVRSYVSRQAIPELGRVVMLGPPNQGSEVVDKLGWLWLFRAINGPAGRELGTSSTCAPYQLGLVKFSLGVIAGNRSVNWINSWLISGPDDGKVSVQRTQIEGMTDHLVLPATHPFIMRNRSAIKQTIKFLRTGAFAH
jgi:triacylglycerol lipase